MNKTSKSNASYKASKEQVKGYKRATQQAQGRKAYTMGANSMNTQQSLKPTI